MHTHTFKCETPVCRRSFNTKDPRFRICPSCKSSGITSAIVEDLRTTAAEEGR